MSIRLPTQKSSLLLLLCLPVLLGQCTMPTYSVGAPSTPSSDSFPGSSQAASNTRSPSGDVKVGTKSTYGFFGLSGRPLEMLRQLDPRFFRAEVHVNTRERGNQALYSSQSKDRFEAIMDVFGPRQVLVTLDRQTTGRQLEDFLALVRRHKDVIEYVQYINEPQYTHYWPRNQREVEDYARQFSVLAKEVEAIDPEIKMCVGLGGDSIKDDEGMRVVRALDRYAPGQMDTLDIHYHTSWILADRIGDRIRLSKDRLATTQTMKDLEIVITENSTWTDDPVDKRLRPQSEAEQAVYGYKTVLLALAEGASSVVFGVIADRTAFKFGNMPKPVVLHKYALNGLFYNPFKQYSDGKHEGPKLSAFALRLLVEMTTGLKSADISLRTTEDDPIRRVELSGANPSIALWQNIGICKNVGCFREIEAKKPRVELDVPASWATSIVRVYQVLPRDKSSWPLAPGKVWDAFPYEEKPVRNGKVDVEIPGVLPVFVVPG